MTFLSVTLTDSDFANAFNALECLLLKYETAIVILQNYKKNLLFSQSTLFVFLSFVKSGPMKMVENQQILAQMN